MFDIVTQTLLSIARDDRDRSELNLGEVLITTGLIHSGFAYVARDTVYLTRAGEDTLQDLL